MPTASEMIVQTLEEAGVEYVFGIPGGGTGQIFQLLYGREDRIKTILVRHEQAAAIMADAYGRATGKPAVVMGQGLFIGSNASFGIMEAMLSSSPMLVLTDTSDGGSAQRPANQSGAGEYGSIDLPNIFKSMSKYTALAASPKEAVLATQMAIKHAVSGRPGPSSVVMRSAAIGGEVDVESPPFIHNAAGFLNTAKPESAPSDVQRVIQILSESRRPVLVAGNGVHVAGAHTAVAGTGGDMGDAGGDLIQRKERHRRNASAVGGDGGHLRPGRRQPGGGRGRYGHCGGGAAALAGDRAGAARHLRSATAAGGAD